MGDLRHSFDPVFFTQEEKEQLTARRAELTSTRTVREQAWNAARKQAADAARRTAFLISPCCTGPTVRPPGWKGVFVRKGFPMWLRGERIS